MNEKQWSSSPDGDGIPESWWDEPSHHCPSQRDNDDRNDTAETRCANRGVWRERAVPFAHMVRNWG